MEKVGASERTTDEDHDIMIAKFDEMMKDMNECGAGLHNYLSRQKTLFDDAEELAKSLGRVYRNNLQDTEWPSCRSELNCGSAAALYEERWYSINNVMRSSASTVNVDHAVDPMRQAVTRLKPDMEATQKERTTQLTDYDSYRRRLKALESKKEALQMKDPNSTAANENQAEIEKFENKVKTGLEGYTFQNEKAKQDIRNARKEHDDIMDTFLVTTVVCQAELFRQAAEQLEGVLADLPAEKVNRVRMMVHEYISQGGILPAPAPSLTEKSNLQKGLAIISGKNVPSDFQQAKEEQYAKQVAAAAPNAITANKPAEPTNPFTDAPTTSAATSGGRVSSGGPPPPPPPPPPAAASSDVSAPTAPVAPVAANTQPPPPAPPVSTVVAETSSNVLFVEALFDNEADEDDELSFAAGDVIEVLEKGEGGWWRGRVKGTNKEGLFPYNYVRNPDDPC